MFPSYSGLDLIFGDFSTPKRIKRESPDKIFTDKYSGKGTKRPRLEAFLTYVRQG